MPEKTIRLTGAILADVTSNTYAPYDLLIAGDKIENIFPPGSLKGKGAGDEIDLSGCVLAPGLIDMHVHLREPGGEVNELIETGLKAAAAGGFTTICSMPNSGRVADTPDVIEYIIQKARSFDLADVLPIAAVTKGLAGRELTDMATLKAAGAIAFSDDGMPLAYSGLLEIVLNNARELDTVIIDHCEDPGLKRGGVMHEGVYSAAMGLAGVSAVSEAVPVARNILLAQKTGARIHIAHLSVKESVSLMEYAAGLDIPLTAEATPHHIRMTDEVLLGFNTNGKVSPPLRGEEHRLAVARAVKSGLISCIATDHAPWPPEAKAKPFLQAPNGICGLETALAVAWDTLVVKDNMAPLDLLARFITGPAKALGVKAPSIKPGAPANLVAFDPDMKKEVKPDSFYSKGKNSPFTGMVLRGWPVLTIYRGKVVMEKGRVI